MRCCGCGRVFKKRDPWGVGADVEAEAVVEAKDPVMMQEKGLTKDEPARQDLNHADPDEPNALLGGEDEGVTDEHEILVL